jgi:uncharacterized ubiquitin-like protein YukD
LIEFVFTVDYEIYGNGKGSLRELVYEPASQLIDLFLKYNARSVFFVEVAELEMMERSKLYPEINLIKEQVKKINELGFELGLHLHPQWYAGEFKEGKWFLEESEYDLCLLPERRIKELISRAVNYLKYLIGDSLFTPLAYRAGNWLMTSTKKLGPVLAEAGLKIDSSVFKGGYQHLYHLDFRQAPAGLFYWRFSDEVTKPDPGGQLLEIPIYTKMIPTWKFLSKKRLALEAGGASSVSLKTKFTNRYRDFLRFKVPLKFDFCRLSFEELKSMTEELIAIDACSPSDYKPIVLIGHTKDRPDYQTIELFLAYLADKGIKTTTFRQAIQTIALRETE